MAFHHSHQQRNHPATTVDSAKNQTPAVTRDLLWLFIEMDDSALKKAVLVTRNQLESALEQEVEVKDLDATTNNFDDMPATPKFQAIIT